jgi:2-keto-4-pentenoate hydratase
MIGDDLIDVERVDRAARLLRRASLERTPLDALEPDLAPLTRAAAYAMQAHGALLSAQPVDGWKIAATSEAGQRHINVPGPMAGRIVRNHVYRDGDVVPLIDNAMLLAEVEFVFVMRHRLAARDATYTDGEVAEAVDRLHLGVELPSTRYVDPTSVGELQLIADNACSGDFVLGPEAAARWSETDLAATSVSIDVDGGSAARHAAGAGSAVLGHPMVALTWLVNELSRHGLDLEAGQFVTTGTCCTPVPVRPGEHLVAQFDALGTVECFFGPTTDNPVKENP